MSTKVNKTKLFFIFAVIVLIAAMFFFFFPKENTKKDLKTEPVVVVATTTPVDVTINDTNAFYKIKAVYPNEPKDTKNVMKDFVTNIVNKEKEDWKIGGEAYNSEKKVASDFPDRPLMQYELNIQYKKFTSTKFDTVSYVFQNYEFTGGAHGNTALTTFTFGVNGLTNIEDILDLSSNNNDIKLTKIVEKKLETILGQNLNQDMLDGGLGLSYLSKDGTFDSVKCQCDGFLFPSNFQRFKITDEGIVFIFEQYQVAPYAVGQPEVLMSWKELEPFMKK
jgi:hypothetical protein